MCMKKTRIIVEISGGSLVNVYSSDPNVEVNLLDWDNAKGGDATPQERNDARALEKRVKNMKVVF